jgi:hypothetical protein
VKNFKEANINASLLGYADNLMAWVNTNMQGPTVRDVLRSRKIVEIVLEEINNLSQTYPFKTFTPQYEMSALPDNWRYMANFQIYGFSYLARSFPYHRASKDCIYVIGDCENRAAHSHNRHHELRLGLGGESVRFWAMGIQ